MSAVQSQLPRTDWNPRAMSELPFKTAVIVGAGAVGRMLGAMLERHGIAVAFFDRTPAGGVSAGDACSPDASLSLAGAAADVIVLALPESALETALPAMAAVARPDALIVETASVKTPLEAVKRNMLADREILGINPMFAPSVGARDQAIALVRQCSGVASDTFASLLVAEGAILVDMDAERHDRKAAAMQAMAHAAILTFAGALAHSGESLDELLRIAPPPFRILATLTARLLSQSREIYWDIQACNPYAAEMREHMRGALAQVEATAGIERLPDFTTWLDAIERDVGPTIAGLGADCARLFAALPPREAPAAS